MENFEKASRSVTMTCSSNVPAPEVIACHYISGAGTFEMQVMATDLEAFSKFSIQTLLNLPNVKDIHTSFSLGEVKAGAALPLGHLGLNTSSLPS